MPAGTLGRPDFYPKPEECRCDPYFQVTDRMGSADKAYCWLQMEATIAWAEREYDLFMAPIEKEVQNLESMGPLCEKAKSALRSVGYTRSGEKDKMNCRVRAARKRYEEHHGRCGKPDKHEFDYYWRHPRCQASSGRRPPRKVDMWAGASRHEAWDDQNRQIEEFRQRLQNHR